MNILTDYILQDANTFVKYTTDVSPDHGRTEIKLKEQLIVFVIQPNQDNINTLIFANSMINGTKKMIDFSIIFVPKETTEIIEYIISMSAIDVFDLYSFNIEIIPTDLDLYSMDMEESFSQIYIDQNYDSINQLASIVFKFEAAFGKIKHKYIKGDKAKLFNNFLKLKEEEHNVKFSDEVFGMIVLDRSADFITPVLSNLTYEGAIDEHFGIKKGCIKVKRSYVKANFNPEDKKKKPNDDIEYPLTSEINKFYSKLRIMNYLAAFSYTNDIRNTFIQKITRNDEGINTSEMVEIVTELNKFVDIKNYLIDNINILQDIYKKANNDDYEMIRAKEKSLLKGEPQKNSEILYDDYISEKKDFYKILNLMILESLTQGGLKNYSEIKKDMLNIYGFQKIFLLRNLEKLQLLKEKDKVALKKLFKSDFQTVCEKLDLNYKDFTRTKTDDLSYVQEGFCPISLKLIQRAAEGRWSEIRDSLQLIPGETILPNNEYEVSNPTERINTIFVVFVGGATYSEIEGIRYLNRKYKQQYDASDDDNKTRKQFIIITTQILNSKKMYDNLGKNFGSVYTIKKFYNDNQDSGKKK